MYANGLLLYLSVFGPHSPAQFPPPSHIQIRFEVTNASAAPTATDAPTNSSVMQLAVTIKDVEHHVAIDGKMLSERKSALEAVVHFISDLGEW